MSKIKQGCRVFRIKYGDVCRCGHSLAAHTRKARKLYVYQQTLESMRRPKYPKDYRGGILVPVRAHFRRQRNYMIDQPKGARGAMAIFLRAFLAGLAKE